MKRTAIVLSALLLAPALAVAAQPATAPLPDWDRLTPAQREVLVAPLRERWDANPQSRAHMWDHAQRWRTMTPEQRARARRGMARWQGMSPQQREQARQAFERMRELTPEQRKALREKLRGMTPEQREAWLKSQGRPA
ncbi:MAG TPA: DUF3106 domain-containing protein [Lysobacter sp.]